MKKEYFKKWELTPTETVAGNSYEFIIKLTMGKDYTNRKSRLVFDFPGTLGMSRPALLHQEEPGFVEAYISNPKVDYEARIWDMEIADFASKEKTSWRGMGARTCVLDLSAGLKENDIIELHWGETCRGYGPATKITNIVPRLDYESVIHARCFESQDEGVPDFGRSFKGHKRPTPVCEKSIPFKVLPREPQVLQLIRKTDKTMLAPRDMYWNIANVDDDSPIAKASQKGKRNSFGVFEYADKNIQISSKGLPILEAPTMDNVFDGHHIYWGDVHTHSCYSVDCVQREKMTQTPSDLMEQAKEGAGLDFCAITDHHEPHHTPLNHIGRAGWDDLINAVSKHSADGEFLAFPGIEYRCERGDTAVIFNWLPEYDEIDQPEWTDISKVWSALKGKDCLTIPHFHNPGLLAEGKWLDNIDSGVEPALEIFSCHGSYEREDAMEKKPPLIKAKRFDRYGNYFLKQGLHYGFCANSDGHKGVIGTNGITAVFAKSLDKNSILEAYRKRHVYGTTNARIRLLLAGNGQLMGSILPNDKEKLLEINTTGENRLKKVDLFKNGEHFERFCPDGKNFHKEIKITEDKPSNWYVRVTQVDNHMAYSSPIWFE
ncbi:MAG: hypothetical protein A2020_08440 [Lentisphaerae bacterium GWF2_45_14]|nr:MAG: hypothetical protein A2020_08440 [Lentisphaerae bacterium GWF2_45_14]